MGAEVGIIGVKQISMGNCGTNGTMGTTLTPLSLYYPDSVSLVFEEPNKTDLFVEDLDSPWHTIPDNAVAKRLEFSTRNMDVNSLQKFFGGTVVNSTKWEAPSLINGIEQSVKVETKSISGKKRYINIPRGLVRASIDGKLQKKESAIIKVVVDILQPFDGSGNPVTPCFIETVDG